MKDEEQRKILADAAARGITVVEFMKEFHGDPELQQAVYRDLYPQAPSLTDVPCSACPIISEVYNGMRLLANYDGFSIGDYVGNSTFEGSEAESTLGEQAARATICARWFRTKILILVETDVLSPPAADIAQACKPLLAALIERQQPARVAAAVFESTLALMNAYGTECARKGIHRAKSSLFIMMRSALMDLWRMLDRPLTLAEAAAGTGSLPTQIEDEELNAMLKAAELQLGFEPGADMPHALDDMSPGGVLK